MDKTRLSYWFPLLQAANLPVPKTVIVNMPSEAEKEIYGWFDGVTGSGEADEFILQLRKAVESMGLPCFLRTDFTSAKHSWENTCYLADVDSLKKHVFNIVEFSICADLMGIPWDTWVVREFLPTVPLGICHRFGDMPVCKEFRFFVEDGDVKCWHPYWPLEALRQGGFKGTYTRLCKTAQEHQLRELASAAGKAVSGAWSVDILETKHGWYVTDMAEAHKSFHWEGCKNKP